MKIQKYEDWMRPQIIQLFKLQYGTSEEEFGALFTRFYEHEFQREHCIRIVAVDDKKVAGFQSFFYWPIKHQGRIVRSFQSGNSLVHPEYRGKGLFAKMLNFIHEPGSGFDGELLIGFPVDASYNSFMRNGWMNPFNLRWYVKPMNPIGALFSNPEEKLRKLLGDRKKNSFDFNPDITAVAQLEEFDAYRMGYQSGQFFRFEMSRGQQKAFFELKAQKRKKVIKELVIGKVLTTHTDEVFLQEAFATPIREISTHASFSMLSVAVNEKSQTSKSVLEKLGFRPVNRQIYFIAKGQLANSGGDGISGWENWWMFRGDIDTW